MAHKDAQTIIERHLPLWVKENPNIIFTCPRDSMITSEYPVVAIGNACHHGKESIKRFKLILKFMYTVYSEWYTLHEYDSIIFDSIKNIHCEPNTLYCNLKQQGPIKPKNWTLNTNTTKQFSSWYWTHPPLRMDYNTLHLLISALENLPDDCEQGYWDRVVGHACEKNNIKLIGWGNRGCSKPTLLPDRHMRHIKMSRKHGAVCYHGIKHEEVLRAIYPINNVYGIEDC